MKLNTTYVYYHFKRDIIWTAQRVYMSSIFPWVTSNEKALLIENIFRADFDNSILLGEL